jgi:hypothetical protein
MAGHDHGQLVLRLGRGDIRQLRHLLAQAEVTAANAVEQGLDQKLSGGGGRVGQVCDAEGFALKGECAHLGLRQAGEEGDFRLAGVRRGAAIGDHD